MAHSLVLRQILIGCTLAALIAVSAYRVRALTFRGALSAWVVGSVIFGVGGWAWGLALIAFFVSSSLLSRWRRQTKESLGFAKTGRRDALQVWANGGAAVVCAVLPLVFSVSHARAHLLFLAAIAAANADTWATEIGAACGGAPRDLRTGQRVAPGASGAVSGAGTASAVAGALLLGLFAGRGWWIVTLAGTLGALTDSLLGATLQARWREETVEGGWTEHPPTPGGPPDFGLRGMNNDAVNACCTLAAVILCAVLLRV